MSRSKPEPPCSKIWSERQIPPGRPYPTALDEPGGENWRDWGDWRLSGQEGEKWGRKLTEKRDGI